MSESNALKLLLVDDVQENLELLQDVLSENGYRSVMARNGIEALAVLETETVHLIVADAMMPKMDGFQLCKEVRAKGSAQQVPFIIYTGNYIDDSDQEFARSIGVDRYVVKYAGLGALVQAVDELAELRYGHKVDPATPPKDAIDDQAFLEKHHEIVIRKLEEKMAELEMYAETLVRKNHEIQISEERYRGLFDHASIAIVVIERGTGKILDVNKEGIRLFRYSREELLNLPGLPLVGSDPFAASMLAADNFSSGESSIQTKDGEIVELEIGVGPITRPQDTRLILYIRDITEAKKMREHLFQMEKMTLMGRLAAGIAHEIRNPLAAVTLNLQFLAQKIGGEGSARESISDAIDAARRVEAVIENTLGLARITPPVLKAENVHDLVDQAMHFIRIAGKQKSIRIESTVSDELPRVMADAKQIQQVLINIVQNAIDASPETSVILISASLIEEPARSLIDLCVRDDGPGISPDRRKYLFEPFKTTKSGGTGLGLALSKQIMDRHHGSITLECPTYGGTHVHIFFPIQR